MIDAEAQNHEQKTAAIEAERKAVDIEKKNIASEAMTAKYESLFQKEEHASKLELAQTIRKQKSELDKMVPVEFQQSENHPSRTIE